MTTEEDASSSIVVPFDQKWEQPFRDRNIKVFFRKRGPRSFSPDFVFLYIAAPASRLIGRAEVESFSYMKLDKAVKLAVDGGLSETNLRHYAAGYSELAVFTLMGFEEAPSPLSFSQLSADYDFHPPQSLVRLSGTGKTTLEAALGYAYSRPGKAQKKTN